MRVRKFDEYEVSLGRRLGKGAYSKVYKAKIQGRTCAVKMLHKENIDRDFYNEVAILCSLRHPNIIKCYGICKYPRMIIFEYMPNGSLHDLLVSDDRHERMFLKEELLVLALDICRGMEEVHAKGMLHRDLKPANILLDTGWVCKVGDFGIARPDPAAGSSRRIEMTQFMGTKGFMAPEVEMGEPYNRKADVYSFGKVLEAMYESSNDRIPYRVQKIVDVCCEANPSYRPSFNRLFKELAKLVDSS